MSGFLLRNTENILDMRHTDENGKVIRMGRAVLKVRRGMRSIGDMHLAKSNG